jgi:hypothetical protein
MRTKSLTFTSRAAGVALLVTFSCTAAWAQRMPISRVVTVTLKRDRTADFAAAVKEYNAAYAKTQGARTRILYQALTGAASYRLQLGYADWSELDAPPATESSAELARINARIVACFESSATLVTELLPDLSTPMLSEPPKLLRIARTRIRPDKVEEWKALMKSDVLPACKKAGRTLTVRQVRYGGPTNEFYVSSRLANWADAGKNPLRESMGAEAYDRMVAKLSALTTFREVDVYRYRADMSFTAPVTSAQR